MNLWFTTHAVERYRERHASRLTYNQALGLLIRAIPTATPVREKTLLGHNKWKLRNPDVILVTKPDFYNRLKKKVFVVVTILPLEDGIQIEDVEEFDEISESEIISIPEPKPKPRSELKQAETKLRALISGYDWFFSVYRMNRITVVVKKQPPKEILDTFYPQFEGIDVTLKLKIS